MNLLKLKDKTVKIVKKASKIFNSGAAVINEKGGAANIVTDADLNIQNYLKSQLQKILPEADFICEEGDHAQTKSDYLWIIDPIDGTTNFARDLPECAISVGLVYKNESVLGVIYAPRLNLLCTATKGGGAYCNGKKISVSNKSFESSLFCTALCLYKKDLADICSNIISETFPLCSDIRRFGSCALELCYLAMGRCDLFFEIRVFPWDIAAAHIIVSEAGGILKGYNNGVLPFNKTTTIIGANNKENFEKLNQIVLNNMKNPIT